MQEINYKGIILRIERRSENFYTWRTASKKGQEKSAEEAIRKGKKYIDLIANPKESKKSSKADNNMIREWKKEIGWLEQKIKHLEST